MMCLSGKKDKRQKSGPKSYAYLQYKCEILLKQMLTCTVNSAHIQDRQKIDIYNNW